MIILEIFRAMLPGLMMTIAAGAIGSLCFSHYINNQIENFSLVPLKIGLGFVILSTLLNFFLIFNILFPILGACFIIFVLVIIWKQTASLVKSMIKDFIEFYCWISENKFRMIFALLVLLVFSFGFIGLLAPTTAHDTTVYHMTLPKLYAKANGFVPRPDILQSRLFQNLVGVQTLAYQWGGENAVEFLNLLACLLLMWLLVELTLMFIANNRWNWWTLILLFGSFQFIFYFYDADVEGWLSFICLCLFTCLFLMNLQTSSASLIIVAAIGGFLIGIKPTIAPAVCLMLVIYFLRLFNIKKQNHWLHGISCFLIFLFMSSFWYFFLFIIHSDLYKGSLLGLDIPFFSIERFRFEGMWRTVKSILIYNFSLFIYISLIPKSLDNKTCRDIFWICILSFLFVFITNPFQTEFSRYTFYVFPITILGIVFSYNKIDSDSLKMWKVWRFFTIAVLIFCLLFAQTANVFRNIRKLPVAIGFQDKDDYLAKRVNTYKTIKYANEIIQDNGKLFMIAERSYWLDVPYVIGIERNPNISYEKMTPKKFFKILRKLKITHLFYTDEKTDYTNEFLEFWETYPDLKSDPKFKLLHHHFWQGPYGNRNSYLYQFNPSDPVQLSAKENIHVRQN